MKGWIFWENNYFGNFEIVENNPLRIDIVRCESSKALVFAINKKQYSTVLYKEQKARKERKLEKYHISYIFYLVMNYLKKMNIWKIVI